MSDLLLLLDIVNASRQVALLLGCDLSYCSCCMCVIISTTARGGSETLLQPPANTTCLAPASTNHKQRTGGGPQDLTMPPYVIHLSIFCRRSMTRSRESDRPRLLITSRAFVLAAYSTLMCEIKNALEINKTCLASCNRTHLQTLALTTHIC